jgi:hypothetical protein
MDSGRCQAFVLISSRLSPLRLWSKVEQAWADIAPPGVQRLWGRPLYGRHGVGLYITAKERQQIEAISEDLQGLIQDSLVEIRLCKDDGYDAPFNACTNIDAVQGLVAVGILDEAQDREIELVHVLRELQGVLQVKACYGEGDILMLLSADNLNDFRDLIVQKIRICDGIASTNTALSYALFRDS